MNSHQIESWQTTFSNRVDLTKYKDNAIGLFALALKFGIEDLDTVAAESLTDGGDDKCNDLIYIDTEQRLAVIIQCYFSTGVRLAAPSKKASDMNGAISWLINAHINSVPIKIKSAAKKLREGISSGEITTVHAWYVHNCPHSDNVEKELITVAATLNSAIKSNFSNQKSIQIHALEVGSDKLNEWYNDTNSSILVNDVFTFTCSGGYETNSGKWNAFITALPAQTLYDIYNENNNKSKLFSANVRDYLGSRNSDKNINNSIKKTIQHSPEDFLVYNNGITALTHKIKYNRRKKRDNLEITGISIVNGAQTTGAIGGLEKIPDEKALVPIRFIETNNNDLIQNIILFNNSQNQITASDFRSTDPIQKRLRSEINNIPNAAYNGGRRGGISDVIQRRSNLLPSYTVSQALAAFHGNPILSYHKKTEIWKNDSHYSKYFHENTTGPHIIFVFGLLRSIENLKIQLLLKSKQNPQYLKTSEKKIIEYFRNPGAVYLLVFALASCLETFLDEAIADPFNLSFGPKISPQKSIKNWEKILILTSSFFGSMSDDLSLGLNTANIESARNKFIALVGYAYASDTTPYFGFTKLVKNGKN